MGLIMHNAFNAFNAVLNNGSENAFVCFMYVYNTLEPTNEPGSVFLRKQGVLEISHLVE
jgi:hypothetical protein